MPSNRKVSEVLLHKLMNDLESRRRARKVFAVRRRKNCIQRRKQRVYQFHVRQTFNFVVAFILVIIDQTVFRTVWAFVQQEWDDDDWLQHFRMRKPTFVKLCQELEPFIKRKDTHFRKALPTQLRVAVTLWKLATNIEYRSLAELMGPGRSTACEVVNDVCETIKSRLLTKYISLPNEEDHVQSIMNEFENMSGFPQVIGVVDGCHIPIIAPNYINIPDDYFNRKKFYSYILQGFVDSRLCFRNINVCWPGRVHDARVLVNSRLYQMAENGTLVPNVSQNINNIQIPPIVLGDSAYPLKTWLMRPYKDTGNLTREQKKFNRMLSKTRIVIEHTFGRLKGRWRCLLKRLDCETARAPIIISACCVLHNFCEINREEFDEDWLHIENIVEEQHPNIKMEINRHAIAIRNALCHSF